MTKYLSDRLSQVSAIKWVADSSMPGRKIPPMFCTSFDKTVCIRDCEVYLGFSKSLEFNTLLSWLNPVQATTTSMKALDRSFSMRLLSSFGDAIIVWVDGDWMFFCFSNVWLLGWLLCCW